MMKIRDNITVISIAFRESTRLLVRLITVFSLLLTSACLTQSSKSSTGIPTSSPTSIPSSSTSSTSATSSPSMSQETTAGNKTSSEQGSQTSDPSSSNGDQSQEGKTDDQILAEALDAFDNKMKSSDQQSPTQNSGSQSSTTENNSNSSDTLTDGEKLQRQNQQLSDRFSEFDSMILAEREKVEEKNNEEGSGYGNLDGGFIDDEPTGDEPLQTAMTNEAPRGSPGFDSTIQTESRPDIPPDIPSAEGDDIIARQLREAAIKEKDPDLRAKLWDEYRKYKKGA